MLADDIGGRTDLEIVQLVVTGNQIGMPVFHALTAVGAEEERLGRAIAGQRGLHVVPQCEKALLRIVPAVLVEYDVSLDHGSFVTPRVSNCIAIIVYIRAREWSAMRRGKAVQNEVTRLS